ncbi:cytochrome P450 [Sphingomonas bacterium]|uniref:cytochrome P450 n=1 Tax=Sphingomonas bacterium TaxID=1895847 RepID=UPI001C2D623B|nr:cytochrome P450 [Sphingomonas bacterium]
MSTLTYNPYAPENVQDPYPLFKQMRDEVPVYHNPEMKFWALSRYDDVCMAHRDTKRFSSAGGVTIEGAEAGMPLLILRDPPDHSWHKGLVTKVFTPGRMASLEPFIRATAIELLEAMNGKDEVDFVHDFTVELPLSVICELIEIPREIRREVHERANAVVVRGSDLDDQAAMKAMFEQLQVFQELAADRRANPRDDVITLLINTEVKDEDGGVRRLDDTEIATHFIELATAGHETVAKAIANGLIALHHFPEQRARIQADPSLIPAAVEELLRYDPPSQLQGRTTTEDVTLHGVTIPAGSKTMLITAAATRDERAFENPDVYDVGRSLDQRSVYFGFGIHKCLGIHLARLEMRIALEELFRRYPDYRIDPEESHRPAFSNLRGVADLRMWPGQHA